jgi:hypothetical protein
VTIKIGGIQPSAGVDHPGAGTYLQQVVDYPRTDIRRINERAERSSAARRLG